MYVGYIIAFASATIALLALIASIVFNRKQQEHNVTSAKNSVRPYADFVFCCSDTQISVLVGNAGIGPMIVRSLKVKMNGKEMNSVRSCFNVLDNADKVKLEALVKEYYFHDYGHLRSGEATFPPTQKPAFPLILFRLNEDVDLKKAQEDEDFLYMVSTIVKTLREIELEIVYWDIYETEYITTRTLSSYFGEKFVTRYEKRIAKHPFSGTELHEDSLLES